MTDEKPDKKKPGNNSDGPRRPGGKTDRGQVMKGAKKGAKRWLLRVFRGYDNHGKRIYYSETFIGGSREADDRLIQLRNNHRGGKPLKFEVKTFKDFFD